MAVKKIQAVVLDGYMVCREPYNLKEVEGVPFTYENCNFIIVKEHRNYCMYEVHTGLNACSEKTIKAVKEKFYKIIESEQAKKVLENINNMPTPQEKVEKQKRFYDLDKEFTKITGKLLPLFFGVDAVRFATSEGNMNTDISLAEHVEKKYGKRAKEILEDMISMGCVD